MKLITAVTTEPITGADVKSHLRLDSDTLAGNLSTNQSITPGNHDIAAGYSLLGTSVDVLGKRAIVNLNAGTNGAGGTVDAKIQESDDATTWEDWTGGTFIQITTVNDNAVQEKEYTGAKQYIRVVCTVAVAACSFSVDVVLDAGSTNEDDLIDDWIHAAREYGEDYTKLAFAPQTWELLLSDFPREDFIEWPKGPLTSIVSVKYKNSEGTETTLTENTDYIVDLSTKPGKIFLPYCQSWPSFVPYPYNSVTIQAVCGYTGVAPYILPHKLKQAMLVHIGFMNKHRDTEIPEKAMKAVHILYNVERMRWFA
jgi:uncharacterized phiE125 gp8 family phage protein